MIRLLIVIALGALVSGCSVVRPGFVRENSYEVKSDTAGLQSSILPSDIGPLGGHFDPDGNWIPDNPDIPMTYKIPDISAGIIFDAHSLDVMPSLQIELLEIDTHVPYLGTLKVDAGVSYQRTYIYVGKLWTNIFEISTGGFGGWNYEDKTWSAGVAVTIIRF